MSSRPPTTRAELEAVQLTGLRRLLDAQSTNPFYAPRLAGLGALESLAAFRSRVPFTIKAELAEDQSRHPPYGSNRTRPLADYVRLHQTSSTTGHPLRWLDTRESWAFVVRAWRTVLEAAGTTADDRVFVAFSFGPFIGLWLAFEAAEDLGALTIPGGAMSSELRLRAILANEATVLCCTPTYALRLVAVAEEKRLDLSDSRLRAVIVGGEPGGSVPELRARIENAWPGVRVHDHYGMTEVGPVTFQCPVHDDVVHVIEEQHLAEIVDRDTGQPIELDGEATGELVLTPLGREDAPVLRYRTGDVVRPLPHATCACGRVDLALAGGVIGRADDMVHIRGVNVYPSRVDAIVRRFDQVAEYRACARTVRGMSELEVNVEPQADLGDAEREALRASIESAFRASFGFRVVVTLAATDTLPRFELKAKRWSRA